MDLALSKKAEAENDAALQGWFGLVSKIKA